MTAVFRDGVDPLTDDALGRPYNRFDDAERHAVIGFDLTFDRAEVRLRSLGAGR